MRNASPFFGAYLIYKEARPLTHKRVKSYLKILKHNQHSIYPQTCYFFFRSMNNDMQLYFETHQSERISINCAPAASPRARVEVVVVLIIEQRIVS